MKTKWNNHRLLSNMQMLILAFCSLSPLLCVWCTIVRTLYNLTSPPKKKFNQCLWLPYIPPPPKKNQSMPMITLHPPPKNQSMPMITLHPPPKKINQCPWLPYIPPKKSINAYVCTYTHTLTHTPNILISHTKWLHLQYLSHHDQRKNMFCFQENLFLITQWQGKQIHHVLVTTDLFLTANQFKKKPLISHMHKQWTLTAILK